jgi:hypothetical protein
MTTYKQPEVWDFLERENTKAPVTQALYEWGLNCNADSNPFLLFVDLIGWSEAHLGQALRSRQYPLSSFGYRELGHLGEALEEYADQPQMVSSWLSDLFNCKGV